MLLNIFSPSLRTEKYSVFFENNDVIGLKIILTLGDVNNCYATILDKLLVQTGKTLTMRPLHKHKTLNILRLAILAGMVGKTIKNPPTAGVGAI
jgi:hypothetical protein